MRITSTFTCALFLLSAGLAAQQPRTVEGRLLEMLRENGVISATQFDELSDIAAEMRAEQDVAVQGENQVAEMISHLQDKPFDLFSLSINIWNLGSVGIDDGFTRRPKHLATEEGMPLGGCRHPPTKLRPAGSHHPFLLGAGWTFGLANVDLAHRIQWDKC